MPLELNNLETRLEELDRHGYTVFPRYLDLRTTAEIRRHVDEIAGPIVRTDARTARRDLRHPIPGESMARLAGNRTTLALAATIIGSSELRMREQVLVRTGPSFPPYGALGWHIDAAFYRDEFEAHPKQVYYQMPHYCSPVVPGGAAFMIVPDSHRCSMKASDELIRRIGKQPIQSQTAVVHVVDDAEDVEICGDDGDLILFNSLCYHTASPNRTTEPRYVFFTSFYHQSAARLKQLIRSTGYRDNLPDSLQVGLAPDLRTLLD